MAPPFATLSLAFDVDGGIMGYSQRKSNCYVFGVAMELAASRRGLRFVPPVVGCVVIARASDGTFCAGAHIRMLAEASHAPKVNCCKFTNETRLAIEEASA